MSRRVLVIGAHSADFVWRAGGAVAAATGAGGEARVIALGSRTTRSAATARTQRLDHTALTYATTRLLPTVER